MLSTTRLRQRRVGADKLDKLLEKAEKSPDFTPDEVDTLKKMADAWQGLEALGKIAKLVKTIVVYLGWLVGIYFSVKFVAAEWVKSVR